MSRLVKTARNASVGIACHCLTMLMAFINRTVFIYFLGVDYLGLNGFFANIISVLSLAELGIGVAITYSLYKPLAEGNQETIAAYMSFFQKVYITIGFVIFLIGLAITPFLDLLIKDLPNIDNISIIYILILLNTSISYFFSYKRTLLSADQREYLNNINRVVCLVAQSIIQILLLVLYKNYIIYLIVFIVFTLISNIIISFTCDKQYPYLKNASRNLTKSEKKSLFKYTLAQMSHKVGGIVVFGTSNIIISMFLVNGLTIIGIYSNYLLIINSVKQIINTIFNSSTASVGNLNAIESSNDSKRVFDKMYFINMCFFIIPSILFAGLINDFISLWLGKQYLLSTTSVFLIIFYFYISGLRLSVIIFNTTLGLFWNDRFKPWAEAIVNLVLSIILTKEYGLNGILMAAIISTLSTCVWVEPYILYKHAFNLSVREYFTKYFIYLIDLALPILILLFTFSEFKVDTWLSFFVKTIATFTITMTYLYIRHRKNPSSIYFYNIICNNIKRFTSH